MVTIMDAYEYHQENNPEQYTSTDDEDVDRKDFLVADNGPFDNNNYGNDYAGHLQQTDQFFGGGGPSSYIMSPGANGADIKPNIPPLVPPTYLQSTPYPYNAADYYNNAATSTSGNSNPYQNYAFFNKPSSSWYNQVKSEQMASILNRYDLDGSDSKMISGREARNRAEKNRRDKLNNSISEISGMVPHVADAQKRVDKTAVLRLAAHALRTHYVFGNTSEALAISEEVLDTLLDGFILTLSCGGQIVVISKRVEQYLGHCQTDLLGQNLKNITHPDDIDLLHKSIVPSDLAKLFETRLDDNGHPATRTEEEELEIDTKLSMDRRRFTIRLARPGPRNEPTSYETVVIDGSFRRADNSLRGVAASSHPPGPHLMRRSRVRPDDSLPIVTNISLNDIVLVARARKYTPPNINNMQVIEKYEYKTRHLMDGRIIDVDERISLVAGYMTDEIRNSTPFSFMHKSDMKFVVTALRQMYDTNQPVGYSCYRLLDSSGKFIYLRTSGRFEINKSTGKVETFVCVNTLVSEEEGLYLIKEMKQRLSVIIESLGGGDYDERAAIADVPGTANPPIVESAIRSLIENFPPANAPLDYNIPSVESDISSVSQGSKTNSVSIIVPGLESIKSTVAQSEKVCKKIKLKAKQPSNKSESALLMTRPSVLRNYPQIPQTCIKIETNNGNELYQKASSNQYEIAHQSTSSSVISNGRYSNKRAYAEEDLVSKRRIIELRDTEEPCRRVMDDSSSDLADIIPDSFGQLDLPVELVEIFDDASSPREDDNDPVNSNLKRYDRRIN